VIVKVWTAGSRRSVCGLLLMLRSGFSGIIPPSDAPTATQLADRVEVAKPAWKKLSGLVVRSLIRW